MTLRKTEYWEYSSKRQCKHMYKRIQTQDVEKDKE